MAMQKTLEELVIDSPAKRDTINFIQNLEMENTMTISIPQNRATSHVQHMRVVLSRMRDMVKKRGKRIKKFKMVQESVEPDPDIPGNVLIKLKKTQKEGHRLYEDLVNFVDKGLALEDSNKK